VRDVFSELNLDPTKFRYHPPPRKSFITACVFVCLFVRYSLRVVLIFKPDNYWHNENNQRNFFVQYAKSNGFDPLVALNWYQASARHIKNTKVRPCKEEERENKEELIIIYIEWKGCSRAFFRKLSSRFALSLSRYWFI
jgi:hypothetical protein